MRYIFVDEAGTSQHEDVTVVVGVSVDADRQLLDAERLLAEMTLSVPGEFQNGFVFHATDIWGNKKYRDKWSMADRIFYMKKVMSIPARMKIPVSVCIVKRDFDVSFFEPKMTREQAHHMMAFWGCMCRADKYIRDRGGVSEVATVVAENVDGMQSILQSAMDMKDRFSFVLPKEGVALTAGEKNIGYQTQNTEQFVSRIRKSIHFVGKDEEPMTQVADAIAYGFRRFFSEKDQFGDQFLNAILPGYNLVRDEWGSNSASTFVPEA